MATIKGMKQLGLNGLNANIKSKLEEFGSMNEVDEWLLA